MGTKGRGDGGVPQIDKESAITFLNKLKLANFDSSKLKDFWNLTPSVRLPLSLEITRSNNTAG